MEKIDAKNLTDEQLAQELVQAQEAYDELVYNHNVSTLSNPNELKIARRNIARIKTEMRSRELIQLEEKGEVKRDRIRARRKSAKKSKK